MRLHRHQGILDWLSSASELLDEIDEVVFAEDTPADFKQWWTLADDESLLDGDEW